LFLVAYSPVLSAVGFFRGGGLAAAVFCGRVAHETLIEKRLQSDVDAGRSIRVRTAGGEGGTVQNATGNFLGEFLAVVTALGVLCLIRISEKSAFDQHGRNGCFPQNKIASTPDSAIFRERTANHSGMNTGSERRTVAAIEVCPDAVAANAAAAKQQTTYRLKRALIISGPLVAAGLLIRSRR